MTAGRTFFLNSGLPFLTEARKSSPTDPVGTLLNTEFSVKELARCRGFAWLGGAVA